MFKLIKIFISAGLAVLLILVILYFLPTDIKIKGLQAISGVAPDNIKGEIESFVLTPPEKRDKILKELQASLEKIEILESSQKDPEEILNEVKREILNTKKLTDKLGKINNDSSFTNIITSKLVDKFIGSNDKPLNNSTKTSTTTTCNCKLDEKN